jgi:vacuolar-type H+-ATPase subunit I/STV1
VKTDNNIKKVALILFLVIGIIHIISGLMFTNNYYVPYSLIVNRALDIPFAMTAIIYAFMTIYTNMEEESPKKNIAKITLISFTVLIFAFLIYINLFIPDKPSLITP